LGKAYTYLRGDDHSVSGLPSGGSGPP